MSFNYGLTASNVIHLLESVTGVTALGNDTTNVAVSTAAPWSTNVVEFDKANGAANTKLAAVKATVSVGLREFSRGDILYWSLYVSATTDIDYAFVRLGVDATDYTEFRVADSDLVAGWNNCKVALGEPTAVGGAGASDPETPITHMQIGVAFDAETDTLADIKVWRLEVQPRTAGLDLE